MVSVEDDWFGSFEFVLEGPSEPLVPTFSVASRRRRPPPPPGRSASQVVGRILKSKVSNWTLLRPSLAESVGGQHRRKAYRLVLDQASGRDTVLADLFMTTSSMVGAPRMRPETYVLLIVATLTGSMHGPDIVWVSPIPPCLLRRI